MRRFKTLVSGLILGLLPGLWFGFNIGQGRPVYANPFTAPAAQEQIQRSREQAVDRAGESIQGAGEN